MRQLLTFAAVSLLGLAATASDLDHFDRTIAPLLASRCLECHEGSSGKGGLVLSRRGQALAGGESGPAVVPGDLEQSLLWQRVEADEMPPKHPLPEAEKKLLREWIEGGAKWGTDTIDPFRVSTDSRAGYDWWSLQPLKNVSPPNAPSDWARNGIDNFIHKKLVEHSLTPAAQADPRVLVRRLYFDLLGLPPTPEEVAQFVADPSDAAYEDLVTKLLDSPHYGERWGRHWLDVVRFGESDGFERNNPRKNLWHFRDWVINAFNNDMPYTEFARMQLAGDILKPGPEGSAAVGMLVSGVHNTVVGGSERMKLLARQDELEEIVGAVSQTFLGLTANCARCHDHKFDPIRTEEYYQLISAIDGVNHAEKEVPVPEAAKKLASVNESIAELRRQIGDIDAAARKAIIAERKAKGDDQPTLDLPEPYAQWDFEEDFSDSVGNLHGEPKGGAKLEGGALVVDGKSYVATVPIDRDLSEKTLAAWVQLDNLDQRGGGAISIQTLGGRVFDAIVFGEREPKRWMAGSNGFVRTQSFSGGEEKEAAAKPVHFAIVYRKDGTITGYRNGIPYGQPYKTGFQPFKSGEAHLVFGLRHDPPGGNHNLAGKILQARLYDEALDAEGVAASAGQEGNYVSKKAILAWLPEKQKAERDKLTAALKQADAERAELEPLAKRKMYTVNAGQPGTMRVHIRGDVANYGDEVAPSGVAAIAGVDGDFNLAKNAPDAERRRRLAAWITDPDNPLFARVIVNRVWHYHFGTGLVETPNDLGFNGGRPSHPDLIDWLASRFQDDGYRLKALHRLIATSATYRQASTPSKAGQAKDAGSRLLWRFPPRRIEAEAVRDSLLHVAGVLNPERGGPGFEDVSSTPNNGTMYYAPIDPEGAAFNRRTVYRFTPRGGRSTVLDTFDCPDPSAAAPRRGVTTTPLQALSLLNNSFVLRMAEQFAQRVQAEAGDAAANRVHRAWQLAVGREPDDEEAALSMQLAEEHGLPALCRALFNSNEFVVIE